MQHQCVALGFPAKSEMPTDAGGLGKELDHLPRVVGPLRGAKEDEAGSAREGDAGSAALRGRQGRGRPCVFEGRGKAAPKLAEIPRAGDVHREIARGELLIEVRDLRVRDGWRKPFTEEVHVEGRRLAERGRAEGRVFTVRGEE